jgi:hypothetical protein
MEARPLRLLVVCAALSLVAAVIGTLLTRAALDWHARRSALDSKGRLRVDDLVSRSVTIVDHEGDRRGYFGWDPGGTSLRIYKAGGVEDESVGLHVADSGDVDVKVGSEVGGFRVGIRDGKELTFAALDGHAQARVSLQLEGERLVVRVFDASGKMVEERFVE